MKGGGPLETLGRAEILLLDKTGTLTVGAPAIRDVETYGAFGAEDVLRLAASVDQVSPHVLARAVVAAPATNPPRQKRLYRKHRKQN